MCLLFVMVNGFFEPSLNGTIMEFPSKVNIDNFEKQEGEQVNPLNTRCVLFFFTDFLAINSLNHLTSP